MRRRVPPTRYAFDCGRCRGEAPANLTVTYADGALAGIRREAIAAGPRTLWRWAPLLPVDELGVRLWVKNESRNPTWSFKDRLASVVVDGALDTLRAVYGV